VVDELPVNVLITRVFSPASDTVLKAVPLKNSRDPMSVLNLKLPNIGAPGLSEAPPEGTVIAFADLSTLAL